MDIEEIKAKKQQAEADILAVLRSFEETTGTRVSGINSEYDSLIGRELSQIRAVYLNVTI